MPQQKTFDPYSFWKEYYETAESYWEKSMEETMKREEFSEWLGKILDFNLGFRKNLDIITKQYLEQMNVPSKNDLANLSALIVNVDAKIDALEEQVEERLEISELKDEIKIIQTKLEEILQLLKVRKGNENE